MLTFPEGDAHFGGDHHADGTVESVGVCRNVARIMFSLMEGQLNNMYLSFDTDDYYDDELVTFLSFLSRILPEGDTIFNVFYKALTFLDTRV